MTTPGCEKALNGAGFVGCGRTTSVGAAVPNWRASASAIAITIDDSFSQIVRELHRNTMYGASGQPISAHSCERVMRGRNEKNMSRCGAPVIRTVLAGMS